MKSIAGREFIRRRLLEHETYLVLDETNIAVATFTVQWSDRETWGDRGVDGSAVYVYGPAVRRGSAGRGIGYAMIDAAEELGAARQKQFVRLDCMASNPSLCEYYRRAGFAKVGVAHADKGSRASQLFERPIQR
jgi:ribosomal protein S18 acetylase RimI-like enzyme